MGCLQDFVNRQLLRELPREWRVAYLFFALAYILILFTSYMIFPATLSIFIDSLHLNVQPIAQSYLPLVLLPVLLVYNFLWAALQSPQRLVLVVCCVYAVLYAIVAVESFQHEHVSKSLAWVLYYTTNTKQVLFPVMFWSVVNDLSSTRYSNIAYPAMVSAGQLGGLAGSLMAAEVKHLGVQHFGGSYVLIVVQVVALLMIAALVWIASVLAARVPQQELLDDAGSAREGLTSLQPVVEEGAVGTSEQGRRTSNFTAPSSVSSSSCCCVLGFQAVKKWSWQTVEGITLILTKPYVAGIFWVACAHLVPRGILDYQGTSVINERWPEEIDGRKIPENVDKRTSFLGWCSVANTVGTLLLSLCGLRSMVEGGGLKLTLLILPAAMFISVLVVCVHREFWTVQAVLVVVNVIQYAVNGPSREMLYVRTSKNIKYKAKSWSDMYGNFLQKLIGAQINLHVNNEQASCEPHCFKPVFSGIFTAVWVAVWALVAGALGVTHARLVERKEIVS